MLHRVMLIVTIALAGPLTVPAASDQAERAELIYSPWTKLCIKEMCFVGKDAHTECAPIFAVVLVEDAKDTKKLLRVTIPTSVNTDRGVRITIDQAQPIARPFERCYAIGCVADYEAGAELVDQLKQGRTLTLDTVDTANSPVSLSLPLIGFAAAYDGPAQAPKVFELQPGKLQEELHARTEDDREARCKAK